MAKSKNKRNFFIGIDLGGREKKTTGICILEYCPSNASSKKSFSFFKIWCKSCQDIYGKEVFKTIEKYLKETKVIAIDAPLTSGRGRGKMRLFEKFLATKIFRKEKVNPIPPALMPELCVFALELRKKLEKRRFILDINLIEVFPILIKKIRKYSNILKNVRIFNNLICKTEHQKSALICAQIAFLHSHFQTGYLGYKDGFLFLPKISFWKKEWRQKFFQAWFKKDRLKYRHLKTNIF